MSLYEQWKDLIENQTEKTFHKFWEEYSSTEKKIYSNILENKKTTLSGTVKDLYSEYEADPVLFMGFLDGINSSLKNELKLEDLTEESNIELEIDFEKLYFNMLKAEADYLYSLEQWNDILDEARRNQIIKEFKQSKTVRKEKSPGRNDPCPCGSGKKYKKCCGAN